MAKVPDVIERREAPAPQPQPSMLMFCRTELV